MGANAVTTTFDFTAGQVLTAAQMDNVNCGVQVFETTATRDAAFGGTGEKVLAEGQTCYIEAAPNRLQIYDGATWRPVDLDTWTAYTPTIGAQGGTITTVSASGAYAIVGKTLTARFSITITTNGTGGGAITMTLPFAQAAGYGGQQAIGFAREGGVTGNLCQIWATSSGNTAIATYANAYPGADGAVIAGTLVYELSA
jgi:hypothetical protein